MKRKKKESESPRRLDTKSQCVQPQTVHHTGLSGAIQNSTKPRPCSSGPQAAGPGQAHHWAPSCVPLQHCTQRSHNGPQQPLHTPGGSCLSKQLRLSACEWDSVLRPTWVAKQAGIWSSKTKTDRDIRLMRVKCGTASGSKTSRGPKAPQFTRCQFCYFVFLLGRFLLHFLSISFLCLIASSSSRQ